MTGCFNRNSPGRLRLDVDDTRPPELRVLELEIGYLGRFMSVVGIPERICNDATAPDLVVERIVDMAMTPNVRLLQQGRQVACKSSIRGKRVRRQETRMDAQRMRRMMCDDDRLALKRRCKLTFEPRPRNLVVAESVGGGKAAFLCANG